MGRPLNKKYFGNRNIGGSGTGDDYGIGGEGIASVVLNALGSYTTRPTITFPSPGLPTGVLATGTITSEVLSAAISGTQTRAYPTAAGAIGFNTGGSTFTATVTSSALTNVVRASATTLGFDTTTTAMISGTSIHITGASITGTMTIGGTTIAAGQIYYVGAPTGATTATLYATYADAQAATSPLTIVAGTGVTGATFTRGVTHGTVTALTPIARGSYEALVASGPAVVVTAGVGEGLVITPTYRAKSVTITEEGSGYTSAPSAGSLTFSQSVTATSVALTTDSGNVGSSTNQENAIQLTAFIPLETEAGWVSGYSGSSAVTGDIVRQSGNGKFIARTAQGVGRVKLVGYLGSNVSPTAGEAVITASDYDGGLYYVTKISDRRCNIIGYTGSGFTTGETGINVPWTFNNWSIDADANQPRLTDGRYGEIANVKINNA